MNSVDTTVRIKTLELKNPVIAASGTFGCADEYAKWTDISKIGAISVKGTTLTPRLGNPTPRICETPSGILNSVGLENPGIDAMLATYLPKLIPYNIPIIMNIAGNTPEEYALIARKCEDSGLVDAIEVNISCPNVKEGGHAFGTTTQGAFSIISAVRKATSLPIIAKLTPNAGDLKPIAKAAEEAGADAISLINTITGMCIDIETRKPLLANITGGMSGPAVKPIAVRMVWEVRSAVEIPIIGLGGIQTAADAIEFLIAGADAIQVGTASFVNPNACVEIAAGICAYLARKGYANIQELSGSLCL